MSAAKIGPAYRVETERLVLRCWHPQDAPLLKDAIDISLDHLRPWMPWAAHEPEPLANKVERLRRFRGEFDFGLDFTYAIFNRDETEVWGGTGLHTRIGPGALEIGYWIRADQINKGLATEAAAALTRVAFEIHGVQRVEIQCRPENAASAAVPRKLGYKYEGTLRRRLDKGDGVWADGMIWTMFADEYPNCPAATARLRAFDAVGAEIVLRGQVDHSGNR